LARSRTRSKTRKPSRRTRIKRRFKKARRRVARSKFGRHVKKHGKSIESTIISLLGITIPVSLLSENQVKQATGLEQKFKAIVNGVTGSIFNINIFDDAPKAHYHPSLEGAFNMWSFSSAGAIIAGNIAGRFGIKGAKRIENGGKKLLLPSVLGGVFGFKNTNGNGSAFNKSAFLGNRTSSHNIQTIATSSRGIQ